MYVCILGKGQYKEEYIPARAGQMYLPYIYPSLGTLSI